MIDVAAFKSLLCNHTPQGKIEFIIICEYMELSLKRWSVDVGYDFN